MIFLQQSKTSQNDFFQMKDASKATHYQDDNGNIRPLTSNDRGYEAPLDIPHMNFGKQQPKKTNPVYTESGEAPLGIPRCVR